MIRIGRATMAAALAAAGAAALAAGCAPAAPRPPRTIGAEVLGALTPAALREVYRTPAFVVRSADAGRHAAVQDTDLASDSRVDDANLLIFAEGSADSVDGFRATARLLAESPHGFASRPERLVIVCLKWSKGTDPVPEHLNRAAQEAGAVVLADMLEVHRRRHPGTGAAGAVAGGDAGRVALIGFSAGTRVIEMAFAAAAARGADGYPEALARVENVVFVGSSVGSEEPVPLASVGGRFINFVNPRDTHFGDRAAYVAPAGEKANPLKLLQQATIQRRPRFGASVAGFRALATITAAEQFDALEALDRLAGPPFDRLRAVSEAERPAVRQAFRMVNVPVPLTLVAFNLFGDALLDDDFDDYLNQAPNHYILVGRGPGGRTEAADFRQYRAAAEEFVREFVAPAALRGRLYRFDLKAVSKGANPLGLPLPVPWAIFGPSPAPPPEDSKPPAPPQEDSKPPGAPAPPARP